MKKTLMMMMMGGGAAAFKPSDVAGLVSWLDFSDLSTLFVDNLLATPVTVDGDMIGAVKDKTLLGHNVIQATDAKKPLYKTGIQNGLSVARGDGSDDILKSAAFTFIKPEMLFCVFINRGLTGAGYKWIVDGVAAAGYSLFYGLTKIYGYAGINYLGGYTPTVGETFMASILFNGTSSWMAKNQGARTVDNAGGGTAGGITLFNDTSATYPGQSDICEVLAYNVSLADADIIKIENYLNNKWGVFTVGIGTFTQVSSIDFA